MSDNRNENDRNSPLDELTGALRDAVAEILAQPIPEDLTRQAVEAVRSAEVRRPVRRVVRWAALAAAASIGAIALGWQMFGSRPVSSPRVGPQQSSIAAHENASPALAGPTAWAYQQAAHDSPDTLDALLDRHARQLLPPEPDSVRSSLPSAAADRIL